MELFLFSWDVIVFLIVVVFLYNIFDVGVYFGICDKIVLGLLIGVFLFGYLFGIFIFFGFMYSGISNEEKGKVWVVYVEGKVDEVVLLEFEEKFYYF